MFCHSVNKNVFPGSTCTTFAQLLLPLQLLLGCDQRDVIAASAPHCSRALTVSPTMSPKVPTIGEIHGAGDKQYAPNTKYVYIWYIQLCPQKHLTQEISKILFLPAHDLVARVPKSSHERPMALRANGSKTHYTHHTVHPHHDHRESSNVAPHGVPKVVCSHRVTSVCTARISTTVNQFNLDHCWTKLLPQT